MFYKSILNAVAIAVAVTMVMFVGCVDNGVDPNNRNNGDGLIGDWSVVEMKSERDGQVEVRKLPDDAKMFFSFKSNTLEMWEFKRISNFWLVDIEGPVEYRLKDDNSICIVYYDDEDQDGCFVKYSISGNNLTIAITDGYCDEFGECRSFTETFNTKRDDLTKFRRDLGGSLKSRDPKLITTDWFRPSSDPDCEWCGNGRIEFWSGYYEYPEIYLSESYEATWYTEDTRLTLVGLNCDRYETVVDGEYEWEECVSYSVAQTVTLEYQLTGEILRLRPAGSNAAWDVWTPSDGYYFSQSKAKSKKGNGAIIPFLAFRR